MDAIILSAGEGRRLRPMTLHLPKPLIPVSCEPFIEFTIRRLESAGVFRCAVNIWYKAEMIEQYLSKRRKDGMEILPIKEKELYGTGGGISNAASLISGEEPIVVHNCDIYADINMKEPMIEHRASEALVTLLVKKGSSEVNTSNGYVVDIAGKFGNNGEKSYKFTGISIWEREALKYLPLPGNTGCEIESLAKMISCGEKVRYFDIGDSFWCDIGSCKGYMEIHKYLYDNTQITNKFYDKGIRIKGFFYACEGAKIGEGSRIENVVVWAGGEIRAGEEIENAIIGPFGVIRI